MSFRDKKKDGELVGSTAICDLCGSEALWFDMKSTYKQERKINKKLDNWKIVDACEYDSDDGSLLVGGHKTETPDHICPKCWNGLMSGVQLTEKQWIQILDILASARTAQAAILYQKIGAQVI